MVLYVVLRHPNHPEQTWSNAWRQDKRLVEAIMTNNEVAPLCTLARQAGEYVYVHRCAYGGVDAEITSRAKVQSVMPVDGDSLVSFSSPEPVAASSRVQPCQGQDFYFDVPPLGY